MAERLPQLDPDRREVALMSRAIKACMLATAASRGLDATICAAAFPSLAEMEELEPGIWRGSNGERVRALRYSRIWKAAATLVPALVEIIEREAPGISIRVLPLTTRDPRRLLEEEAADMAVGYFPAALADLTARAQSGGVVAFESRRLYDGEYVCVMRQGHPLADAPLTLDTYCAARHMLVSFSGRPFGFIDEALASLGRERKVVITVNQFFTAGRVVSGSDLLTVLPRHFVPVTGIADALVQRALPLDVPAVHVDALWRRRGPQQAAMTWLLQALARSARRTFPGQDLHGTP